MLESRLPQTFSFSRSLHVAPRVHELVRAHLAWSQPWAWSHVTCHHWGWSELSLCHLAWRHLGSWSHGHWHTRHVSSLHEKQRQRAK